MLNSSRPAIRVLHITDTLGSGGKERQLIELLRGFNKIDGFVNELVVLSDTIHYDEVGTLGIKIHIFRRSRKWDFRIFEKLYGVAKRYRPNIIYSWESMCSVYASPIALLFGSALINGMIRYAPLVLNLKDQAYRRLLLTAPFSTVILANSLAGLRAFRVDGQKGLCIHNGFNFNRISDLPDVNAVKRSLEIRTSHVVGMIARFHRQKDYSTFFKAAKLLCSERKDITFVAVGEGPDLESFRERLKSDSQANIRILGVSKRVEEIVKTFSVGVLVTDTRYHGEGIANAILEYMALEKPVIATDAAGNREIVKDGENGFLIPFGDENALALRIREIVDRPDVGSAFGRAGRALVEQKFGIEQMVQKHVELFRRLASGNRAL
ncbi:glycosyltransferase [Bradyrhizobium sp. CB1717]|uniref:glycosyltransferase n=1 Tax=Bradyrhizobium sp. CB1717 TaxID=3039154 RepID=UPI0024B173BA|nr:glycosyltransferase [Bradyrhizobium sp. CB1717]WFU22172.1 glycosyltransferase [Bradyrhizobium sp. CB1717]